MAAALNLRGMLAELGAQCDAAEPARDAPPEPAADSAAEAAAQQALAAANAAQLQAALGKLRAEETTARDAVLDAAADAATEAVARDALAVANAASLHAILKDVLALVLATLEALRLGVSASSRNEASCEMLAGHLAANAGSGATEELPAPPPPKRPRGHREMSLTVASLAGAEGALAAGATRALAADANTQRASVNTAPHT